MSDVVRDSEDPAALIARVRALEAENARLRAVDAPPSERRRGRARWRAWLSAVCIVVAAVLVPVSIVAAWARTELVDQERFVATLAPLADDPAIQDLVIGSAMSAIDERVDYAALTGSVIDGITGLGLPPRAAQALELLQQPAADGLRNIVGDGVATIVRSDAFADVWTSAVAGAHRAITATATSDGGGVVVLTEDGLGVRLGPIIEQVKQRLVAQGVGVAALLPAVDRTIIVGTGQGVSAVRVVYALALTLGWWLPVIALALLATGVLVARRRSVAVVGSGVALAIGAGLTTIAFAGGAVAAGVAADQLRISPPAVDVVYHAVTDDMAHTATITVVLGVVIAILGWALSSWRTPTRLRRVVSGLDRSARASLASRGLDTGRTGLLLARHRTIVRIGVLVLAAVWLALLRPLSAGDILLVVVIAIVVAWTLELLQVRPDEEAFAAEREPSPVDDDRTRLPR